MSTSLKTRKRSLYHITLQFRSSVENYSFKVLALLVLIVSSGTMISNRDECVNSFLSQELVLPDGFKSLELVLPDGFKSLELVLPDGFKSLELVLPDGFKSLELVLPDGFKSLKLVLPDGLSHFRQTLNMLNLWRKVYLV